MTEDAESSEERETKQRIADRYPGLELVPSENRTIAAGPADRSAFLDDLTALENYYVLNHHPTPSVDDDEWTVSLTGALDAAELDSETLRAEYPTTSVTFTMECAGNGRSSFESVDGHPGRLIQWAENGVSTGRWTGTPLSALLDAHDAATGDAYWLTAIGGEAPPDADVFARSLPMAKILDDCLLAYEMNGEPLPPEHGHPFRLVVPGWYGVNSVKWVRELRVMDAMIAGPAWDREKRWQQDSYRLAFADEAMAEHTSLPAFDTWDQLENGIANPYLYNQHVMSLVVEPDDGETVVADADGTVTVRGVAWAGTDTVAAVAVSADGGASWHEATLDAPETDRYTWRRFRATLELDPGDYRLVSEATDGRGRTQPAEISDPHTGPEGSGESYPWNREGYGNNAYRSYGVAVTVE